MTALDVTAQLEVFERLCRERRALNIEQARPGITADRIRSLEGQYELELPEDAKAVWLWHDGADMVDVRRSGNFWAHHGDFLDLESSIRDAKTRLEIRNSGDVFRRPGSTWVTLAKATIASVIDVSGPEVEDSPVLISDASSAIEDWPVVTLAEQIGWWNWAIENEVWYLNDDRQWRRREDKAMGWPERALV